MFKLGVQIKQEVKFMQSNQLIDIKSRWIRNKCVNSFTVRFDALGGPLLVNNPYAAISMKQTTSSLSTCSDDKLLVVCFTTNSDLR